MTSRIIQNQGFHVEGIQNPWFWGFRQRASKMTPLELPGAPKMEAKITPGAAQDVEKRSKNLSGGTPGRNQRIFFSPPEAPGTPPSRFKIVRRFQTPGPRGPQGLPAREGPGCHFGMISEPPGPILEGFPAPCLINFLTPTGNNFETFFHLRRPSAR